MITNSKHGESNQMSKYPVWNCFPLNSKVTENTATRTNIQTNKQPNNQSINPIKSNQKFESKSNQTKHNKNSSNQIYQSIYNHPVNKSIHQTKQKPSHQKHSTAEHINNTKSNPNRIAAKPIKSKQRLRNPPRKSRSIKSDLIKIQKIPSKPQYKINNWFP